MAGTEPHTSTATDETTFIGDALTAEAEAIRRIAEVARGTDAALPARQKSTLY